MPQIAPMELREKDMWGASMFDQLLCRIAFRELRYAGPYTKLTTERTLIYPGYYGGMNWGGLAVDKRTNVLIVNDMRMPQIAWLVPQAQAEAEFAKLPKNAGWSRHVQEGTPYQAFKGGFNSPLGIPCHQPSWGSLTGLDLNSRSIAWQVPLGTVEDARLTEFVQRSRCRWACLAVGADRNGRRAGVLRRHPGLLPAGLRQCYRQGGLERSAADRRAGNSDDLPVTRERPPVRRGLGRGARMMPDRGDYVIAYALPKKP
jgi:quinate dehydrogenase (quinone)